MASSPRFSNLWTHFGLLDRLQPEEVEAMEEPLTPPSMLRMARRQADKDSFSTYLSTIVSAILRRLHPLAVTFNLPVELKDRLMVLYELPPNEDRDVSVLCCITEYLKQVLIKVLTTRRFVDGKTKTYCPYVINAGQLTPSIEGFVMVQLWRLAASNGIRFREAFGIGNRKKSSQVLAKLLFNIVTSSASDPPVPNLAQLVRMIKDSSIGGKHYEFNEDALTRIAFLRLLAVEWLRYTSENQETEENEPSKKLNIWPWVDYKLGVLLTTIPKRNHARYHEAVREIDRRLFDGVRSFATILEEDKALLRIFIRMGDSAYSYRLPDINPNEL
ncbi:hypothetical protein DFH28DRAFT_1156456 [Melampsora americana]|nr:hypothetical protein DFH28DRAFT_1156456 [Melampsora americana]